MSETTPFRIADQQFDPDIPIASLREHPENYNRGDVGAISESMDEHGFYGAVLVQRSSGRILAGNHRYRTARDKGATTLPGFWLDCDDDEARRLLAVDNRTTHLATFDEAALIALLKQAQDSPRGLAGTGYDQGALAMLIRHQASITAHPGNPDDEWEGMPDFDQPGLKPAYSIVMHFPSTEDADNFFRLIGREWPRTRFLWWPNNDGWKGSVGDSVEVSGEVGDGES